MDEDDEDDEDGSEKEEGIRRHFRSEGVLIRSEQTPGESKINRKKRKRGMW